MSFHSKNERHHMHTIHSDARPAQPRDSRQPGQAAYNHRGERLVKRHRGPAAIPFGRTVIEATGDYATRRDDGLWDTPLQEAPVSTLDLHYPVVEIATRR